MLIILYKGKSFMAATIIVMSVLLVICIGLSFGLMHLQKSRKRLLGNFDKQDEDLQKNRNKHYFIVALLFVSIAVEITLFLNSLFHSFEKWGWCPPCRGSLTEKMFIECPPSWVLRSHKKLDSYPVLAQVFFLLRKRA